MSTFNIGDKVVVAERHAKHARQHGLEPGAEYRVVATVAGLTGHPTVNVLGPDGLTHTGFGYDWFLPSPKIRQLAEARARLEAYVAHRAEVDPTNDRIAYMLSGEVLLASDIRTLLEV